MKTKMKMKIQQLINISRVWVCVWVCVLGVDSSRPVAASVADTSLEMIMESLHPPRNHRLLPNMLSPHPPCDYPKMLTEALVVNLSTYKQIFFLNMRKLWMLWQWGKVGGAFCLVKSENWVCKVFLQFFVSFFLHFAMGRFLDLPISQHCCCCLEFARVCLLGVWAYLSCVYGWAVWAGPCALLSLLVLQLTLSARRWYAGWVVVAASAFNNCCAERHYECLFTRCLTQTSTCASVCVWRRE